MKKELKFDCQEIQTVLLLILGLAFPVSSNAQFTYTNNADKTITITDYTGAGGNVTIPTHINGFLVTSIANRAFQGCTSLTAITIPNSVTDIEDGVVVGSLEFCGAFFGCTSLTNVMLGNSVTNIGSFAFGGCPGLTSITIPDSITSIGASAFWDCTSLTNVTIGKGVTTIRDWAFASCTNLTAIAVDAFNPAFSSLNGVLFNKSQTALVEYPEGLAGSYTIPNSVTSIGDAAFRECTGMTNLTIGSGVTTIGGSAFWGCRGLTSVTIPNSVTSIGYTNDEPGEHGAFGLCDSLTSVTIGNNVTIIGDEAFIDCTGLTSVTIPNSVITIGGAAFMNSANLTNVIIGSSVTNIGDSAFYGCRRLTSVTIPNSVTSLGADALEGCTGLTSVTIPNRVTNIGDWAFQGCYRLSSVYFKGNAPKYGLYVFRDDEATVYYLPGTTGWGTSFGGLPTALWVLPYLVMLTAPSFGVQTNGFAFTIHGQRTFPLRLKPPPRSPIPSGLPSGRTPSRAARSISATHSGRTIRAGFTE